VIAQVKRIAANGSIPSRQVAVPGPLVDCVVVVDEADHDTLHPMSYLEKHNSAFTGEIRTPQQSVKALPMSLRKLVARRAFLQLRVSCLTAVPVRS
jgi:propionate CoA-transferase